MECQQWPECSHASSSRPLVVQSLMFPPCLYKEYTRQVFDTFIREVVVHACSRQTLRAPGAGGDIDESDQCCQVVEGDVREMVAPQWEAWVGSSSPQLLKGSCVKCDMLKPTDASTDSQLWWNPVHRRDDELCLSCGCVVLPAPISLRSCLRSFVILVCLPGFLYGLCFDTPSEMLGLKDGLFFQVSEMDTKTCTIRLAEAH